MIKENTTTHFRSENNIWKCSVWKDELHIAMELKSLLPSCTVLDMLICWGEGLGEKKKLLIIIHQIFLAVGLSNVLLDVSNISALIFIFYCHFMCKFDFS